MFSKQWPYIGIILTMCESPQTSYLTKFPGFAIVLAVLNIILAIWTMSYLRVKKERASTYPFSFEEPFFYYLDALHSPHLQPGLSLHSTWGSSIRCIVLYVRGAFISHRTQIHNPSSFRVKVDDNAEPMMIDVGHSIGVVFLFSRNAPKFLRLLSHTLT
jgi:hypothetical protein